MKYTLYGIKENGKQDYLGTRDWKGTRYEISYYCNPPRYPKHFDTYILETGNTCYPRIEISKISAPAAPRNEAAR